MATKIRLTGETPPDAPDAPDAPEASVTEAKVMALGTDAATQQMLKYAEAIDWKLWEILKLLRKHTGE